MRVLLPFAAALFALAAPAQSPTHGLPSRPLLVGYLPQWGIYGDPPWIIKDLVTSGAAPLLDQVNYAQVTVRDARCVVADPEADTNRAYAAQQSVDGVADPAQTEQLARTVDADPASAPLTAPPLRGGFHQLQLLRARYGRLRTVVSIEGHAPEFAKAALPENRSAFVSSCVDQFIAGHLGHGLELGRLFDGIDLDWEFPQAGEGENFTALVEEFRRQLDAAGAARGQHLLLSVAGAPGLGRYPGVDWHRVAAAVDELGLMNYDYSGPWQSWTGLLAPLYPVPGDPRAISVDATVHEYEAAGVPAAKLLLGVPFYGYGWTAVDAGAQHGLFQNGTSIHGDRPYREISAMGGTVYRAEGSSTAWLYDGTAFWTFDDPSSARDKASYAATHGLGGAMIWELSGDTANAALMHAMRAGLDHPTPAQSGKAAAAPIASSVAPGGPAGAEAPAPARR